MNECVLKTFEIIDHTAQVLMTIFTLCAYIYIRKDFKEQKKANKILIKQIEEEKEYRKYKELENDLQIFEKLTYRLCIISHGAIMNSDTEVFDSFQRRFSTKQSIDNNNYVKNFIESYSFLKKRILQFTEEEQRRLEFNFPFTIKIIEYIKSRK